MFDLKTQIGVKSFSFREIKDNGKCADAIRYCASSVVDLSGTHVNYDDPASWADVIATYRARDIAIAGIGAVEIRPDEAWNRRFFDFARQSDAKLVSVTFQMEDWEKSVASVEKLTEEYQIPAAIHNHGGYNWLGNATALAYVFKRSSTRLGLCLDTAWCIHTERENPVGWLEKFGGRTYGFHFKDFTWDRNGKHCDVIVGEGALDLPAVLAKFKELDTVRSAVLEYEGKDAVECTKKSIENIRNLY